ncbi:MAG: transporter substrate-binding domain-containing protein [Propionibacteriaceae bacterium]|jgi:polar amino acid transport system substrate-binding protein|nr:transporter substrate-binding domain-containing protein [Propionibacteriaceae bacterium]
MMKKTHIAKALVAIVGMTALLAGCSGGSTTGTSSDNPSAPASEAATGPESWTLENNPLRGTTVTGTFQPDWGLPLAAFDDKGDPVGYIYETVAAAAAELGATIELIPNDWKTTVTGVQSGKYDVGLGTDILAERIEVVDQISVYSSGYFFITPSDQPDVGNQDSDLCGLTVASIAGDSVSAHVERVSAKCVADGKEAVELLTFPDKGAEFLAVKSGRARLGSVTASSGGWLVKEDPSWKLTGPQVIVGLSGFAVSKESGYAQLWADAVNASIADGTYGAVLTKYGIENAAIEKSEVNPTPIVS